MIDAGELRRRAEQIALENRQQKDQGVENLTPEETRHLIHELQVHQIELELQNEELRRTNESLDESRERYFDLYDMAPVGYMSVGRDRLIHETNLTAASLLGRSRNAVTGQRITSFVHPEDQDLYYLFHNELFDTGKPRVCRLRMTREKGPGLWIMMEACLSSRKNKEQVCRLVLSDISELTRAKTALEQQLEEQQILLRETHHRIKNNVASIAGLLSRQAEKASSPEAVPVLQEALSRVRIMDRLYSRMILSDDGRETAVGPYLTELTQAVISLYSLETDVRLETEFDSFNLGLKQLFPLGVIVNELVTNSMKYAFEGRDTGVLRICSKKRGSQVSLTVSDNGIGLPDGFSMEKPSGFGLTLVHMLSRQLDASLEVSNNAGTQVGLEFSARH